MAGITTSIRLTAEERQDLEQASGFLGRGKNWILKQALQFYLLKLKNQILIEEAKRQSVLACKNDNQDELLLWK